MQSNYVSSKANCLFIVYSLEYLFVASPYISCPCFGVKCLHPNGGHLHCNQPLCMPLLSFKLDQVFVPPDSITSVSQVQVSFDKFRCGHTETEAAHCARCWTLMPFSLERGEGGGALIRGFLIISCSLGSQHLQPVCQLQFFEPPPPCPSPNPPSPISLYAFCRSLKPAVFDTQPS